MENLEIVIEKVLNATEMETDDGGRFKCFQIEEDCEVGEGMYVKICSWAETKKHLEFDKFINRKVRITIETID